MPHWIHRASDDRSLVSEAVARTRALVEKSFNILKQPAPDTFLGRARSDGARLGAATDERAQTGPNLDRDQQP
jgi:hypothetical protein